MKEKLQTESKMKSGNPRKKKDTDLQVWRFNALSNLKILSNTKKFKRKETQWREETQELNNYFNGSYLLS